MPAVNVARTDTFEQQRVKINELGSQLFQISSGGSDLSTGNLKLGDGTVVLPSLAFVNDSSLGIYRSSNGVLGFASQSKKLADLSSTSTKYYKDFIIEKNSLDSLFKKVVLLEHLFFSKVLLLTIQRFQLVQLGLNALELVNDQAQSWFTTRQSRR